MNTEKVLHLPFNIKTHKETFINYLEVCIDEHGIIHYAVPSHQEFLIRYTCKKLGLTRDELNEMCPKEYYCDFIKWLTIKSECIAVWNDYSTGDRNEFQEQTIQMLKSEGLYSGV